MEDSSSTPPIPGSVSSLSSTTETIASAENSTSTETLTAGETSETSDTVNSVGLPQKMKATLKVKRSFEAVFQSSPPPLHQPSTSTVTSTHSNETRFRTTYRCSFYRRRGDACHGRCERLTGTEEYTNFIPRTCNTAAATAVSGRNIRAEMEERVGVLAVTQLEQTANQIWRRISTEFYLGKEGAAVCVYHVRRLHFEGDICGT